MDPCGRLFTEAQRAQFIEREGGDDENQAGQQVCITGKNKTYIATTDKNGAYERFLVFETPRLNIEASENKTFELRLPESPCQ